MTDDDTPHVCAWACDAVIPLPHGLVARYVPRQPEPVNPQKPRRRANKDGGEQ
jgi:hypothetical protein